MKTSNTTKARRDFIKKSSASALPFLLSPYALQNSSKTKNHGHSNNAKGPVINFIFDGLSFSPEEYIEKLGSINASQNIQPDFYGNGGITKQLEDKFAQHTGKQKAIYLPSGTMANQLAIKLLNQNNTKAIVPENSHIFRDEADAAQSVHNKRLIPIGQNKAHFDLNDLKNIIKQLDENEVFKSGLGTVAIENPVRRADGKFVPIETIQSISTYCKANNYKLHLDGARIHIAAAYSNISVKEYASHFDTVYISLYKYLNAAGGAMLCGDSEFIDQLSHQIKIFGGTCYQTWTNTAIAFHYLDDIENRWAKVVQKAKNLIDQLNKLDGISIQPLTNGTNIYDMTLSKNISLKNLANFLNKEHQMWLGRGDKNGIIKFTINESVLFKENITIVKAWKAGVAQAKI